jgi:hypothetical protein
MAPAGEDHLGARRNARVAAIDANFHADRAAALEQHAPGLGAQHDSQVRPSARGRRNALAALTRTPRR